ncbi:phage tail-collar fiber domain-containing protein [Photorhabdus sp. SF281]|uniref:phage tail-collar fiber domain-containing protein n=1 Tax=Photorhabdus sp. SF281 TaxID=3459527 RepID=UPI004044C0AC
MASVITVDFEKWKAQQAAAGKPVVLDEFVFAYVPDLDPALAINRDETLPAESHIVHRQAVNKTGLASENAVAYSVTLGTEVGHFDFNWIGLINKASGIIGMLTHAPAQKKIKTANGLQGNVLTRSFLLEFEGAAKETAITTTAETWQIDFTARLSGIDEMQRLMNTDSYGEAAFFGDGFSVVRRGDRYTVKRGLAYIGGLRGELAFDQTFNRLRDTRVYADFSYQGNVVSQWKTVVHITAANDLKNYIDAAGYPHYVFAVAGIDGHGDVLDLRINGSLNDRDIAAIHQEIDSVKREYATQQALESGLHGKQPKGDYATSAALTVVSENANSRLAKNQNGADIPNKSEFVKNIGLVETVEQAMNAVPNDRRINGKLLSSDISLMASDVGAYHQTTYMTELPGRHYSGPFSCGRENGWAKGVSIGIGGDTGQIWIDADAQLHTRFLNANGAVEQKITIGIPIGATIEWHAAAPIPAGYEPNEGRSFRAADYPELAKIFPDLKLPDDRGLFKRGLDRGRGLDSGRSLGSVQGDAIRNITGSLGNPTIESGSNASGAFSYQYKAGGRAAGAGGGVISWTFDASRVVPTANENRPVNKSVIYITRVK